MVRGERGADEVRAGAAREEDGGDDKQDWGWQVREGAGGSHGGWRAGRQLARGGRDGGTRRPAVSTVLTRPISDMQTLTGRASFHFFYFIRRTMLPHYTALHHPPSLGHSRADAYPPRFAPNIAGAVRGPHAPPDLPHAPAMRPWELDAALQRVPPFQRANAALEQYPTAPDIAAGTLAVMRNDGAVDDALLADFGCGTARLSVAAALYGAAFIIAVDVDEDGALSAARQNASDDYPCIDFVRADVAASHFLRPAALDAVVMNPPFGTKRQGVDVAFLARAARSTRSAVYSMHKTSTRDYIARTLQSWHANGQVK